ncbi:Hypp1757 [Branchiostoma lanceolatum]|uniref:Hypp1757 protein n=1 Tax=Branchiostoma lanceolatum TaxID=7740 RepID=A0A8K0EQ35_BRALA|nr:Hypp1757 [Branchiostoma lanceolatum]
MDPKQPQAFWKTIKSHLKKNTKTAVQPLKLPNGEVAVTDQEIAQVATETYAPCEVDMYGNLTKWKHNVTNAVQAIIQHESQSINDDEEQEDPLNADLELEEVQAAINRMNTNSAPSPIEGIHPIMIKKVTQTQKQTHGHRHSCWNERRPH